jgi:serine/threonine-protein kinase
MVEPTACRFWQATLQSGLADAHALQPCWDAIPPEKRVGEHIDRRLAKQAVQAGVLTLWQAQQILAGRSTGFKIDRYTLLELIGQGGMGRVYLARDTRLNRRVAVKILSPERVNNPRAITRFHREALVGAQLQHENLVRIYDEGESTGKCYLVMEYIEGKNIGQMIAEAGPLPPPVAARLARQVALGLEHAQRKGLIHRDVNPYNILVTRDGTAKLTDLGLAIDLAENDRVTRDGATVGTFDYVSPEQARHSHSVDTRSDIYSLGCSLYHMLCGQVPFPSASLPEKLFGHQASEPEPVRNLAPAVPAGLAAVVAKTMRKSPDDRYATPLELAQALEPFADETAAAEADFALPVGGAAPRAGGGATVTRQIAAPPGLGINHVAPAAAPASALASATVPEPEPALAAFAGVNTGPVATTTPAPPTQAAPAATPPSVDDGLFGMGLAVDLGPEPPLTKVKDKPKPKEAPRKTPSPEKTDREVKGHTKRGWLLPAGVAGAVIVLVAVAALAYRSYGVGTLIGAGMTKAAGTSGATSKTKAGEGAGQASPALPAPTGKEVRVVAADGTESNEPDFRAAVRAAIGSRGHVLLLNRTPLTLSTADAVTASGGVLSIRAGAGLRPVLKVEVKGATPFLSTRTDAPLKLEGLTIEATYSDPGASPAAVIEAGGNVSLDRCAFRVATPTPGARALTVEGGALTASGCWFEGFDQALDTAYFGGSTVVLRHCMFVRTAPAGDPVAGWAVRLRSMPGGFTKTGRRLALERCTVSGGGFLDFAGFSPNAPVKVEPSGCAVAVETLVSWEPGTIGDPHTKDAGALGREALAWSGHDNQYEVRGKGGWVRVVPTRGAAPVPMPDGPTDLASWQRRLATESDPVPPPVRFATDPASLSEQPTPADFAIADTGLHAVGADPAFVGPGAKAVPAGPRR